MHWLQSREIVPAIIDCQQAADQVRQSELERARRLLARGESPELVLEQLAHGLTQKYMHGPLAALNRSASDERQQLLTLLPRLLPTTERRRDRKSVVEGKRASERVDPGCRRVIQKKKR